MAEGRWSADMGDIARECRFFFDGRWFQKVERNLFVKIPRLLRERKYKLAAKYIFRYAVLLIALVALFALVGLVVNVVWPHTTVAKMKNA